MPTKSKVAAEPRIRIFHCKSRSGCRTCKQRRVKCDEERPVCRRCMRSRRECIQEPEPAGPLARRSSAALKNVRGANALAPPVTSNILLDEHAAMAIDYFCHKSVPILQQCRPSPLWNHLLQLLHTEGPVIRNIACAIGHHQRAIEYKKNRAVLQQQHSRSPSASSPPAGDDSNGDEAERAAASYTTAIRALRKSIATPVAEEQSVHALSCMLLVVLESLRGATVNVLLHLQYCIRLFHTHAPNTGLAELMESTAQVMETFLVSTMTADPFSPQASLARQLLREIWMRYPARDQIIVAEQRIMVDLTAMLDGMALRMNPPPPPPSSPPAAAAATPQPDHCTSVASTMSTFGTNTNSSPPGNNDATTTFPGHPAPPCPTPGPASTAHSPASSPASSSTTTSSTNTATGTTIRTSLSSLHPPGPPVFIHRDWQREEAELHAVFEARCAALAADPKSRNHYGFVLARTLTTAVLFRRLVDPLRPQAADLATFQRIVDLEEAALAHLQHGGGGGAVGFASGSEESAASGGSGGGGNISPSTPAFPFGGGAAPCLSTDDSPAAFSLGLGAISVLAYVAMKCKDFYLRRRALLVMQRCPAREGVWSVAQAQLLCRVVIQQEERRAVQALAQAGGLPGGPHRYGGGGGPMKSVEIPPHYEIAHAALLDGGKIIRLSSRSRDGVPGLEHEDIPLAVAVAGLKANSASARRAS